MAKNEKFQLSRLVPLKMFLATVLFLGGLSQTWAGLLPPPIIVPLVGQPASQKVVRGATVQFNVLVTSLTTPSYQWRFNGTNIPNATASSYTLTNVQSKDAGKYSVVIRNAGGSTTSEDATLTVDATPVRITTSLLSNGLLNLHIEGPLIATYIVQSSTDLQHWTSISTNLVVLGLLDLPLGTSKGTGGASCFYRVLVK